MKFRITRTSDAWYPDRIDAEGYEIFTPPEAEINTIEDLRDLPGRNGEPLVVHFEHWADNGPIVEIYDDYRE